MYTEKDKSPGGCQDLTSWSF